MVKDKYFKFWVLGFILASFGIFGFFYYVYQYRPVEYQLPKFDWIEIILIFMIGFFPSVISRVVANVKLGQVDLNFKGFVDSVKDAFYGWIVYYFLFVLCFIFYDWVVWSQLPTFW